MELDSLFDVRDRFVERRSLRLAPLQLGAPCVKSVLILLNDDARFARHTRSLFLLRMLRFVRGQQRLHRIADPVAKVAEIADSLKPAEYNLPIVLR